jgi:hypothetical protein
MAIAFGLTMVLGFQDIPAKAALDDAAATGEVASEAVSVAAPAIGEVVSLESVPDKVFASCLGAGLAVVPPSAAFAPVSGTFITATSHATASRPTTAWRCCPHRHRHGEAGRKALRPRLFRASGLAGQTLAEFDIAAIEKAGYNRSSS